MNKNRFRSTVCLPGIFLTIFVVLMLLVGESVAQTKAVQKDQPQYGGTLRVITTATPVNLGVPWERNIPDDQTFTSPTVETLLSLDDQGNVIPLLATGWKISKDLKSITLTLRKGVKFHDGTDFNAEAVKYVLDRVRVTRADMKTISSIDIVDPYTVKLNLTQFNNSLLNTLTTSPGEMVSPTSLKTHETSWAMVNPVGTGPFKFVKYERDTLLRFEKFAGYWQKGKPYLDAVEFRFITDPLTAIIAFKNGEGDILMRVGAKDAVELQALGKYFLDTLVISNEGLVGDGDNPKSPFADMRVRRAIEHAIDKERIAKELYYGIFKPADQAMPQGYEGYNPAVKGYAYDPKKAKDLLAEAGYPNGFKTRIIYRTFDNQHQYVAIQAYLKEVGIEAVLEPVSNTQYAQISSTSWENALKRQHFPSGKGMRVGQAFLSNFSRQAVINKSIFHSDSVEAKAMKAVAEPDNGKSKRLAQDLVKAIHDEAVFCPILTAYNVHARTGKVRDAAFGINGPPRWTPADAWLSK